MASAPEDTKVGETHDHPRKSGHRFWLALALILLISLLIPATREVQLVTLRQVFHLPGRPMEPPLPPDCMRFLPTVRLTGNERESCLQSAGHSPRAYLLARCCATRPADFPEPAAWKDSRLLEWAATEGACRIAFARGFVSPAETQPVVELSPQSLAEARTALQIIHDAEKAEPGNGALWLAESLVQFELGAKAKAIEAAESAASKTPWKEPSRAIFLEGRDLLEARGLSRYDASLETFGHIWFGPSMRVSNGVGAHLARRLQQAVIARDNAEFASLLSLCLALRSAASAQANRFSGLAWWPPSSDAVAEAMADRLGVTLPEPAVGEPSETRLRMNDQIVKAYAGRYLDSETQGRLRLDEREKLDADARKAEPLPARFDRFLNAVVWTNWTAGLPLLLAILLAALLLMIPFFLVRLPRTQGDKPQFPTVFWIAGIVTLAAAVLAIFAAIHDFMDPDELDNGATDPIGELLRQPITAASLLCGGLFAMQFMRARNLKSTRIIPVIFFCVYLAAVIGSSYIRHRVIQCIEALYLS